MRLRVRDEEGGEWREVAVPRSVRALVLLNLQSYGGGRDIVGLGDSTLLAGQEFKRAPIFDDALIEVVGRAGGRAGGWVGGLVGAMGGFAAVRDWLEAVSRSLALRQPCGSQAGPGVGGVRRPEALLVLAAVTSSNSLLSMHPACFPACCRW